MAGSSRRRSEWSRTPSRQRRDERGRRAKMFMQKLEGDFRSGGQGGVQKVIVLFQLGVGVVIAQARVRRHRERIRAVRFQLSLYR